MDNSWYAIIFFWILVICYRIYKNQSQKEEDQEFENRQAETFKNFQRQIIENQEEREDFEQFNEDEFWEIVDAVRKKSRDSYKNYNGLLKDQLMKLEPDQLVHLDNLIQNFFIDRYSHDLFAASYILFKRADIEMVNFLMSYLISKGRVFFKQASLDINLLVGKEIKIDDPRSILDVIQEVFVYKTGTLMPYIKMDQIEIKGESWEQKELPSRYSEFWNAFY